MTTRNTKSKSAKRTSKQANTKVEAETKPVETKNDESVKPEEMKFSSKVALEIMELCEKHSSDVKDKIVAEFKRLGLGPIAENASDDEQVTAKGLFNAAYESFKAEFKLKVAQRNDFAEKENQPELKIDDDRRDSHINYIGTIVSRLRSNWNIPSMRKSGGGGDPRTIEVGKDSNVVDLFNALIRLILKRVKVSGEPIDPQELRNAVDNWAGNIDEIVSSMANIVEKERKDKAAA